MDASILSALDATATDDELEQLRRWRVSSLENERRYCELSRLWTAMTVRPPHEEPSPPPDPAVLIQRAGVRLLPVRHRPEDRSPWIRRWLALAATVAVVLTAATTLWWQGRSPPAGGAFGADEFVTGATEMSTVHLHDGTVVRLAQRTRLRLTGKGGDREVSLEGRAYFAVAKDDRRPFRIRTSVGDVTVLGTRFDLQVDRKDLRLIVVEGQVALSAPARETTVHQGEMTRVLDGTPLPIVKLPDVRPMVNWVGNFLAFQSTPLREVVMEIGQQYDTHIELVDSVLAERTVTAWFSDRSLDEVLRIVCAASLAECVTRNGVVTMRPMSP